MRTKLQTAHRAITNPIANEIVDSLLSDYNPIVNKRNCRLAERAITKSVAKKSLQSDLLTNYKIYCGERNFRFAAGWLLSNYKI